MKFLHTSDWHLGKSLYDFSLLEDQTHFIHWLLELLRERPVDGVIIAGDIYDRPVPSGGAVALYDHFLSRAAGELGIPVLAVAGNHDSPGRLQFGSSLYRRSGYHVVGAPASPFQRVTLRRGEAEADITLVPYLHLADARALCPEAGIRTFDDAYRELLGGQPPLRPGVRNLAVAHGFFSNLGGDADPLLTSDSEIGIGGMDIVDSAHFAGYDYVALGHLHAPQRAGTATRYSGSPLKYSLSEEHQKKSVTIVELKGGGEPSLELVPVPALRDVRTVQGALDDLLEPSFHQNKQFGDYVFAEVLGEECAYPMQKLRTLFPKLLGLRFRAQAEAAALPMPRMQARQQISRLTTEDLFCRFFRESRGHEIPPAHLEALRAALAALEAGGERTSAAREDEQ